MNGCAAKKRRFPQARNAKNLVAGKCHAKLPSLMRLTINKPNHLCSSFRYKRRDWFRSHAG
jgi:hypothetical protein